MADLARPAGHGLTSRKARRFSAVFSSPIVRNRLPAVGTDSSAARMPNPCREMRRAVATISSTYRFSFSKGEVIVHAARCRTAAAGAGAEGRTRAIAASAATETAIDSVVSGTRCLRMD